MNLLFDRLLANRKEEREEEEEQNEEYSCELVLFEGLNYFLDSEEEMMYTIDLIESSSYGVTIPETKKTDRNTNAH